MRPAPHQWRGVIEEYRELLDIPDGVPAITLREGGTPLVPSAWLSGLTGGEVWLKVEGDNPTGSFKDRGMTTAISCALAEGAEAVVCASTGNTSASMAAYAARAGLKPLVLVPEGKIAAGKMAQALMHGAQVIMVRGNFDDCLRMAREMAWHYPVALVNSVNPVRLEGQKTAAFEIVDFLGDAPDYHLLPVGNAGNISAYWLGYRQYEALGRATKRPVMRGFQAEGAAPLVTGEPFPDPETKATAIRIGNPASWKLAEEARDESGGRFESVSDAQILAAQKELASRDGVFVEPASAAGVAGMLQDIAQRESYVGSTVVVTVTGHGLKDTATALEGFGSVVDVVVDADVDGRRRGRRARADLHMTFVAGPVRVSVPATSANLGPGFDSLGLALDLHDELTAEVIDDGLVVEVDGEGAGTLAARREPPGGAGDVGRVRRHGCRAAGPPAALPQRDPARARASARRPPRSSAGSAWRGRWWRRRDAAARRRAGPRSPPTSRAIPTTSRPAVLGGFAISRPRGRRAGTPSRAPVDARVRAVVFVPPHALSTELARGLLPDAVPHADAAADAGRAALLVAALGRAPEHLLAATRDYLHQEYRRPAMPDSLALVDALRADGVPAVVSGAGPTVLAFVADGVPAAARVADDARWRAAPTGWTRAPASESTGSA